jgi:hypothetical protein
MLRTSRAAVAVLLIGLLALTVPPQTRDMLSFLDDGRVWAGVSFQFALLVLAGSAWFWSRAALAARFGLSDGHRSPSSNGQFDWFAFIWLPRLTVAGAFAGGIVMALENWSWWTVAGAFGLGVLALLATIWRPRRLKEDLTPAQRYSIAGWIGGGAWARLRTLLRCAPYGAAPATLLLLLGLVPLALGIVEAFTSALQAPNRLAAIFPGPAIALFLFGLMIGPLTAATFVCDGLTLELRLGRLGLSAKRPPVLILIALYIFVIVPAFFHVHTVQLIADSPAQAQPLDVVFAAWKQSCAPPAGPVRPIIVAVSGGATRAGLWGAAVLDQVLQAQQSNGAALFAVSSVSGGSLGTAGAMTLLSQEERPCRAAGLALLRAKEQGAVPLAGDALGPLLGGWLVNDIPRAAFEPIRWASGSDRRGGDSATAIEQGFTDLWDDVRPPAAPGWDTPFLSLFYTDGKGTYRPGMPLWFANGTDATTGNRVITTPIAAPSDPESKSPWPFRGARDFHVLMHADVSIATAINNTARFPYLEPFGEMLPADGKRQVGSLVDGGYFENEGLLTALELAEWLIDQSQPGRPVEPIIVQATGDGEPDVRASDIMTCDNASDGAFIPDDKHSAWQILAPLMGLYHVRGGHSAVLLRQARDACKKGTLRFVHFYLPSDHGEAVPLNWVLSNRTARFIWSAFTDDQVSNAAELARLKEVLAPDASNLGP